MPTFKAKPTKKRKAIDTEPPAMSSPKKAPKKQPTASSPKKKADIPPRAEGDPSLREAISEVIAQGDAVTNGEIKDAIISKWPSFGALTAEKVKKASKGLKPIGVCVCVCYGRLSR